MVKEEYLSKGLAIALMDYFQSIHTTKNPYEAIKILKNEKIDIVISELGFNTIKPNEYLEKVNCHSKFVNSIVILNDIEHSLEELKLEANIFIEKKPISIPNIIGKIKSLKTI